jgi:phytoene/squalene synthetase
MTPPPLSPCADLVRRGDPDRFLAAMTAPPEARERLFALAAFNLEVARIPAVTSEPMLGAIRLQWWRETVAMIFGEGRARSHEVAGPLAGAIRAADLPRAPFDRLLDAREWDARGEAPPDRAALDAYLHDTAGALLELSARALGGDETATRDAGFAFGAANYLRALPALRAQGRAALRDAGAARDLARDGLAALRRARAARWKIAPTVRAAFASGWQAEALLRGALAGDFSIDAGPREMSPFRARASLLWVAATGRW